jgi:hypothetical protein
VVRTYSPQRAVAGGIVLDPTPARKYRRGDEAALALFENRSAGDLVANVYGVLSSRHVEFAPAEIAQAAGVSEDEARAALEALEEQNRLFRWKADAAGSRTRPRRGCTTRLAER